MVMLLLSACLRSPPTRFYLLSALPQHGQSPVSGTLPAIGVGPIRFPDYLDRPEIATGSHPNQLHLAEYHQWAEPLKTNFSRVLGENLALLIPTDSIASFPWDRSTRIDFQVKINVIRFLVDENETSTLIARWQIVDPNAGKTLTNQKSDIHVPVATVGYEAMVAAQSRAVAKLSEAITAAIRAQVNSPGYQAP